MQNAANLKIGQRIERAPFKGKVIGTASYLDSQGRMTFGYVIALDHGFYHALQDNVFVSITIVNVDNEILAEVGQ